jgi:LacI family transcriptional regulator
VATPALARFLAAVALAKGLRVPDQLGLIAADDDPPLCELPPALTSIHFNYEAVGYLAAMRLHRLLNGERAPVRDAFVTPSLVPRLSTDLPGASDAAVASALWYMDDRRTEAIRPRHVAAAMGLSLRRAEQRFRRARGRTIAEEIARARVEHAKLLLGEEHGTVRGIARECAFGSYDALLRAFREHAGMLPSEWRRQALLERSGAPDAQVWHPRRGKARTKGGVVTRDS